MVKDEILNALADAVVEGDEELAEEFSQKALEENPNCVDALNMLAEIDILDGNYDSAENRLRKASGINPSEERTLANMATIYHLRRDTENFTQVEQRMQGNRILIRQRHHTHQSPLDSPASAMRQTRQERPTKQAGACPRLAQRPIHPSSLGWPPL